MQLVNKIVSLKPTFFHFYISDYFIAYLHINYSIQAVLWYCQTSAVGRT